MGGPRPEHSNRLLWFQDLTPVILRPLRFYIANDKRCLPQAVSTAERAERAEGEGQPPSWRVLGLRSKVRREALEYCSVTLLSLRPLRPLRSPRSYAANDNQSLPQSAQSAQSYGERE